MPALNGKRKPARTEADPRKRAPLLALMTMVALLPACASISPRPDAALPERAAVPAKAEADSGADDEEYDATFAVLINSARLEVMLELAFAGAGITAPVVPAEDPVPTTPGTGEVSEATQIGAMRVGTISALNNAALGLVALRGSMCMQGLVPASACGPLNLPPAARTGQTLSEMESIGRDLWSSADPFIAEGCRRGVETTQDPLFCSVE